MMTTIAALQIGSDYLGKAATLEKILGYEQQITDVGAKLVVMPEALLGGYPKGEIFGTRLGYRTPDGRDAFKQYHENAVELDGPEIEALAASSTRSGATFVIGIIEKDRGSLYCTAVFIAPGNGLVAKHRKLMPTGIERLIWRSGDGSTLPVVESPAGRLGAAICWENQMPLLRAAMYAKGVEIWCAPTVDERDACQISMRHIAHEGRCFVVSACQVQPSPATLGRVVPDWDEQRQLIAGGSLIVGPMGDILAGPLLNDEGLLTAVVDTGDIVRARYDLDVAGHYSRPDVFSLHVDESPRSGVTFKAD